MILLALLKMCVADAWPGHPEEFSEMKLKPAKVLGGVIVLARIHR